MAISNPAEAGTEAIIAKRHEHLTAIAETIKQSLLIIAVVAIDP